MIIKNGKRIDGCSDTVPIGTLNPFLGTEAPYGYLICQGQKVSKATYKELYQICGDTFGQSTATEFYLPDLRGQTIAGYKEGDSTFGTLGGLIGSLTHLHNFSHTHGVPGVAHVHSTANHTLTVAEIPSHTHQVYRGTDGSSYFGLTGKEPDGNTPYAVNTTATGGSQPHNHGNTGSTTPSATTTNSQSTTNTSSVSNIQPTMVLNWIVKAFQLMPNQSYVSNIESNSKENTYSCDFINTLVTEVKNQVLDSAFPIGKVEVFFDNGDHSNYLGFTWERELEGLTPVGYKSSDTDYSTIGKTLGAKTHSVNYTPAGKNTNGAVQSYTLTANQIPSHRHAGYVFYMGDGSWQYKITDAARAIFGSNGTILGGTGIGAGGENRYTWDVSSSNPYTHAYEMRTADTGLTGGGQGHTHGFTQPTFTGTQATISMDTRDPQKVVAYWRRVA